MADNSRDSSPKRENSTRDKPLCMKCWSCWDHHDQGCPEKTLRDDLNNLLREREEELGLEPGYFKLCIRTEPNWLDE